MSFDHNNNCFKETELLNILEKYKFHTPMGHFEQAMGCYTRGYWASANAQLRTFLESLFDMMANYIFGKDIIGRSSKCKREKLKETVPPILSQDLNEVGNNGKSFSDGLFKRLHPEGSHPGLSNADDCTFRLNLVVLAATYYLRKFEQVVTK